MSEVKARIETLLHGLEVSFNVQTALNYGANYYQVYNHEAFTHQFMSFVRESMPDVSVITCSEAMTGEDFGYFLRDIPGFLFWLGVNTPYGLHHAKIEPNEGAIEVAIRVVSSFIRNGISR
jgi:N-acetyldiaminopimelate deacetylase